VSTSLFGAFFIAASVAVALIGLGLVHRFVPSSTRAEHNDVAGFIYAMVGVAYAVLLAFVVIVVWEHFGTARSYAQIEANGAASVYELSRSLPAADAKKIQTLVKDYAHEVIEEEWALMAVGGESKHVEETLDQLGDAIGAIDSSSNKGFVQLDHLWAVERDIENNRRLRLLASRHSIPPILWVSLIAGGVITISFSYLFGTTRAVSHHIMVGMMTAIIAGAIFLIWETDSPFSGDVAIHPEAFEQMLRHAGA
jgi:hypothetical protein